MKIKLEYIIIGILIGVLLWLFLSPRPHPEVHTPPSHAGNSASAGAEPSKAELVLFYANWCGHCKEINRQWGDLERNVNSLGAKAIRIESENPEMKRHLIKGFPTLRLFPKGRDHTDAYIEYQGEQEPKQIAEFVREYISQSR